MTRTLASFIAIAAFVAVALVPTHAYSPSQVTIRTVAVAPFHPPVGCPGEIDLATQDAGDTSTNQQRWSLYSRTGEFTDLGVGVAFEEELVTTIERNSSGDSAGLAGASCVRTSTNSWLVGGATTPGASARLVLVNPGPVPVEARVRVHSPSGALTPESVVAVGAQTSHSLLLEAEAANVEVLALHVEATGVGVAAFVQDSRLAGFIPDGTDWIVPTGPPSTQLAIPAIGPVEAAAGATGMVRIVALEDAEVSLSLIDAQGEVPWPGVSSVRIEAGKTADVVVPDVGNAAVSISATAPVVAAGRIRIPRTDETVTSGAMAHDIAWIGAQPLHHTDEIAHVIVPHFSPSVAVYAPSATTVEVRTAEGGDLLVRREMGPDTAARIPVDVMPGTAITVSGEVVWTLLVADTPGFITAIEPVIEVPEVDEIQIAPQPYPETQGGS